MSWVLLHAAAWSYWCGSRDSEEESPSPTDPALCDSALKEERATNVGGSAQALTPA